MRHILLTAAAVTLAGLVGCNTSEPGGKTSDRTPVKETFRLKAPVTATTIKQGDRQTVKLTLDRGKDFQETVTLKADAPAGLTVTVDPDKVKPGDSETVTATVSAGQDAAVGDHTVKVTATPETGNSASVDFKVKVERKKD